VLTLTRTIGETIRIGDDIEVHVVEVRGNTVRLGFKAPREVSIHREEVYEQIAAARRLAVRVAADAVGALTAALGGSRASAAGTQVAATTSDTAARSSA
jgi:carbon storage regulator